MTGGADNRFFSRMMVVGFVALAFAGCAAMLGGAAPEDDGSDAAFLLRTSLDAVRTFAGAAYEQAVVLEPARRLLLRFDATAQHYELRQASHVI